MPPAGDRRPTLEEALAAASLELPDLDLDAYLTVNPDGTKDLRVQYPIDIEVKDGRGARTEKLDRLHFRRPCGKEMDMLEAIGEKETFKRIRAIAGSLTGHDPRVLERLDVDDLTRLQKVTLDFFPQPRPKAFPATGGSSPGG